MFDYETELNEYLGKDNLDFSGKTFFITGATGFIGSSIIRYLIKKNTESDNRIKIVAFIRNLDKATDIFRNQVDYCVGDITRKISCDLDIDYIIHCVDNTNSLSILNYPVNTLENSILGTREILLFAKNKKVKSVVYLSSVEAYGEIFVERRLNESDLGYLDLKNPRNSYPIGKRTCEHLSRNYFLQYGIPVKVVRLAQVVGPGIDKEDNRFFSYLAKTTLLKSDIVLKTRGATRKDYIYIFDAVLGILNVLVKGENGETYNLTNTENFYSILEIAQKFSSKTGVDICFDLKEDDMYPAETRLNLSTKKIEMLGWKAKKDMDYIISSLLEYFK